MRVLLLLQIPLLHTHECKDCDLEKNSLCKPCQALLSNNKFVQVLACAQDSIQDYTLQIP